MAKEESLIELKKKIKDHELGKNTQKGSGLLTKTGSALARPVKWVVRKFPKRRSRKVGPYSNNSVSKSEPNVSFTISEKIFVKIGKDYTENFKCPGEGKIFTADDLLFKNIKFMSTHNSFIAPCQFGCYVTTFYVNQYIENLAYFPICIEIDIRKKKIGGDIIVAHMTKNALKLTDVFQFILEKIQKIKGEHEYFYPLLLSIDTSQIKNAGKEILQEIATLFRGKEGEEGEKTFKNYLISKKQKSNIMETPLEELMNKVILRYRHESADFGTEKNESVPYSASSGEGEGSYKYIYDMVNENKDLDSFFRIYPADSLKNISIGAGTSGRILSGPNLKLERNTRTRRSVEAPGGVEERSVEAQIGVEAPGGVEEREV